MNITLILKALTKYSQGFFFIKNLNISSLSTSNFYNKIDFYSNVLIYTLTFTL
jgi:hypothetical protein